MKIQVRIARIAAATSLIGLVTSQAWAGTCRVDVRTFPAQADVVNLSCKLLNAATTVATVQANVAAGAKSVTANFVSGGVGANAIAQGLDANGNVLCTITDTTAGGAGAPVSCPAAVTHWQAFIQYAE